MNDCKHALEAFRNHTKIKYHIPVSNKDPNSVALFEQQKVNTPLYTTLQKFGITCYIDVFLLSFSNDYFNMDKTV